MHKAKCEADIRSALLSASIAFAFVAGPAANAVELSPAVFAHRDHADVVLVQGPKEALVANAAGITGQPIPLAIAIPPEAATAREKQAGPVFLMFRDVPAGVTFSAGFRLRESWAVSLKDAPNLVLLPPPGLTGRHVLRVTLYSGDSAPPQTFSFSLTLVAEVPSEQAAQTRNIPTAAYSYAPDPVSRPLLMPQPSTTLNKAGVPAQEERELLARAEGLLKSGDFEAARLLLSELAERGSQLAAYRMGQTFDPEMLKSRFIIGLTADVDKARHWYRLAADLGAVEAKSRLEKLANTPPR